MAKPLNHVASGFLGCMKDLETGGQPRLSIQTTNESLGSLPFPGSPTGTLPGSPASSGSPTAWRHLRAVKLGGFQNDWLNVLFVERLAPQFRVNQRETYWPASGAYFIFRSLGTNTWGIAKAKRFQAVKEARSNGVAHSPEGYELWLEVNEGQGATQKTNWREWDAQKNKWVTRPGSGVQSRGKVRPKVPSANRAEVEVQTELQVQHRAVQTIASQAGTRPPGSHPASPTARPVAAPPTTSGGSVVSSAAGAVAREKSPVPKSAMAKPKAKPLDPTASTATSAPLPREIDSSLPLHTMPPGPVAKSHPRPAKSTAGFTLLLGGHLGEAGWWRNRRRPPTLEPVTESNQVRCHPTFSGTKFRAGRWCRNPLGEYLPTSAMADG
eukprot:s91_g13.t1